MSNKSKSPQEKMAKADKAKATDNQNINSGHNTKKEAMGPNTKRK